MVMPMANMTAYLWWEFTFVRNSGNEKFKVYGRCEDEAYENALRVAEKFGFDDFVRGW